jgi:DNA-binding response OmpR family regulator
MKKKILVIEDERVTRLNLLGFLESEGFEAFGAENGRLGVESAKAYLPHLIICDVLMPELDGYDVLTQLQEDAHTAAIPFIFLTVETDQTRLRQSMEMGADDYLSKPVTSERLRRAIDSRLRKQETIQQSYANSLPLSEPQPIQGSQANLEELEQFIAIKDQFLERLFQALTQSALKINGKLSEGKHLHNPEVNAQFLAEIEQEFARILTLSNQGSELQRTMTPQNAKLLQQFNFFDLDTPGGS